MLKKTSCWYICLIIVIVLFMNNSFISKYMTPQLLKSSTDEEKFHLELPTKGYLIKTPGCTIPDLKANDPLITKYIFDAEPIICNNGLPPLFESNKTSIYLKRNSLKDYNITYVSKLMCCYQYFKRKQPINNESDEHVKYTKNCYNFSESIKVSNKEDFVRIQCEYNETLIYKDFFHFISLKDEIKEVRTESKSELNVLVMGLDALSRLNFHRQMPETALYLNKLEAVELLGYNKIGDNTFPNLIVALSGLNETELLKTCWPSTNAYFDDCEFIWNYYQTAGYRTAFGEDAAQMGLFLYQRHGFLHQPTDYFYDHFDLAATKEIGNSHNMNVHECLGSRPVHQVFTRYINNFAITMNKRRQKFFAFFWSASLTHDYLNKPKLGDKIFKNLLLELDQQGVLNNTAMIFLSDHGIRWGDIRSTFQGRMEERLPFLYIILPKWYKKQHPQYYNNLRTNVHRLTTPYDLHETLLNLLDFEMYETRNLTKIDHGISLFHSIPRERTCKDARIAPHWCTCQTNKKLSTNNTDVVKAVHFTIHEHINKLLDGYADCYKLALDEIMDAYELINLNNITNYLKSMQDIGIIFKTKPGDAIFEATVRKKLVNIDTENNSNTQFSITGTVSRLNLYGAQSRCIHDFHLKLYCFCK